MADVVSLLGEVVLTDKEELLIEALRIVDPSIERIAPATVAARQSSAYTESDPLPEVSIHRIELDKTKAVTFSRKQMIIAAKRHIEVR